MIKIRYIKDPNKISSESSQNLVFLVQCQDSNFHLFEFVSMVQRGRYSIITIKVVFWTAPMFLMVKNSLDNISKSLKVDLKQFKFDLTPKLLFQ